MRKNKKGKTQKKKSDFKQLTLEERVKIEIKYRDGLSFREIAEYLLLLCPSVLLPRQRFERECEQTYTPFLSEENRFCESVRQ